MKKCNEIGNSLPLYLEGLLSAAEMRDVEEHLKTCPACTKVVLQLQRSGMMMQELKDVEPPPWFKQKIMVRVREEAERQSFSQKWFLPLRIKIPVQVAAAIVIAVLAVYIYRSGDEQMKTVLPEATQPVTESKRESPPAEVTKAGEDGSSALREKKAWSIGAPQKDKIAKDAVSAGSVPPMEKQANKLAGASDKTLTMKGDIAAEKEDKKYVEPPAQLAASERHSAKQESLRAQSPDDSSLSGAAKKSKMLKAATPAAPQSLPSSIAAQPQARIFLQVPEINSALAEAEKILVKNDARKITKILAIDKAILEAELPATRLKYVLSQFRYLGKVEEKTEPYDTGEKYIEVVVEIIRN